MDIINKGITKATLIPIDELRTTKTKDDQNILPFITTHNPNNKSIFPVIQQAFQTLQQNETTKNVFFTYRLMKINRQASNLKRLHTNPKYSNEKNYTSLLWFKMQMF